VEKKYRITGRVQGVFFRAWTRETALEMGLGGSVRNLPDGSVEACLVGPSSLVARMEVLLWEGSPASRVEGVEVTESAPAFEQSAFRILG
jgi:acylphosphatase